MPRYFFNVHDDRDLLDDTGIELPDRRAVRAEAIRTAGAILKDTDGVLAYEEWVMEVTDEVGRLVLTLRFSAVEQKADGH